MSDTLGQIIDEAIDVDDFIDCMVNGLCGIGSIAESEAEITDPGPILHAVNDLSYLLNIAICCKKQQLAPL